MFVCSAIIREILLASEYAFKWIWYVKFFKRAWRVTASFFVLLRVFVLILVMFTIVVRKAAYKKWKYFTNLLSSINKKTAFVSGDNRTVKLDIFYITGISLCVISFQVNYDFEIYNVHTPHTLTGTTVIWKS
jgi:hypothetical protein